MENGVRGDNPRHPAPVPSVCGLGAVLSLPAIAQQDEEIPIGNGQVHFRRAGDVLHPQREPREVLESLRAQLGPEIYEARSQYDRDQRSAEPEDKIEKLQV